MAVTTLPFPHEAFFLPKLKLLQGLCEYYDSLTLLYLPKTTEVEDHAMGVQIAIWLALLSTDFL